LREYLAALDARARAFSPFAKLAATVKLAQLRRELDAIQLEATDEDTAALRRELDERLNRSLARRFEAKRMGARISIFLMLVLGQQVVLALLLLATMLFVRLAAAPKRWNPVLPHEQPVFLYIFIFFFFFVTPMLALAVLFGGRYFRSWRRTVPATLAIVALSVLGTYLVAADKERANPVRHRTSLEEFAATKEVNAMNYRQWVDANWLMRDPQFQRDYEEYLRNGPGRWITARFDANDDAAWRDAVKVMIEYSEQGYDPEGFREWLVYYLDRNRIYSEDRIEQEADALTGAANQRFLSIWQMEPLLKERDQRLYRAYLGSINRSMKGWGLVMLGLVTLVFLVIYLTGPAMSRWEQIRSRRAARSQTVAYGDQPPSLDAPSVKDRSDFPERADITTPPFFDTPFRLLSSVHRSFVRLAIFTSIFVFAFWAVVYAADLAAGRENAPSQTALMRSHILLGGPADEREAVEENGFGAGAGAMRQTGEPAETLSGGSRARRTVDLSKLSDEERARVLAAHVAALQRQLGDDDYQDSKRFKEQYKSLESQRAELGMLQHQASQIEQTTNALPDQIASVGSRATAAEAQAGRAMGEIAAARQKTQSVEQQLSSKIQEVEGKTSSASEQIGQVREQASSVETRTESLESEIVRLAKQIEARTEEIDDRTATNLKERDQQIIGLQRAAFTAILSNLRADVEEFDRRVASSFYKMFEKGQAQKDAAALSERIEKLSADFGQLKSDEAKQMVEQLAELKKRVDALAARAQSR
jgi:predicted  nucleic acid-binding Zn-ribbon protein